MSKKIMFGQTSNLDFCSSMLRANWKHFLSVTAHGWRLRLHNCLGWFVLAHSQPCLMKQTSEPQEHKWMINVMWECKGKGRYISYPVKLFAPLN